MKTLLTIKQQNEFLANNWKLENISHAWSARGYGSSRIIDGSGSVISKATGCGYDRFGTVIGDFIENVFQNELQRLAKRFCKTKYAGGRKSAKEFYGMFLRKDKTVALDGACGERSMTNILACIGFELLQVGKHETTYSGNVYYSLVPVSKHNRKYIVERVGK